MTDDRERRGLLVPSVNEACRYRVRALREFSKGGCNPLGDRTEFDLLGTETARESQRKSVPDTLARTRSSLTSVDRIAMMKSPTRAKCQGQRFPEVSSV